MEPVGKQIAKFLKSRGIEYAILCSGSRNKFLISAFVNHFKVFDHFDERSAAFFSLGINKDYSTLKSFVCMTSGTAVAEALPAVVEAYYTRTTLLIISADLPSHYPENIFPQKINQKKIFGKFAEFSEVDIFANSAHTLLLDPSRPNHWNICYEEDDFVANIKFVVKPLISQPRAVEKILANKLFFISQIYKSLNKTEKKQLSFLQKANCVVDAFNSREVKSLIASTISPTEALNKNFSEIVLIGGRPNIRSWRRIVRNLITEKKSKLKLLSIENCMFKPEKGYRSSKVAVKKEKTSEFKEELFLKAILKTYPGADFFIGNSLLSYLMADLTTPATVFGNRGANGVDGLVSTFAGLAVRRKFLVGCIGDLSFLYDIQGLHSLKNLSNKTWLLFVFNNKGGLIFKKFALDKQLTNSAKKILRLEHSYKLEKVAEIFGLPYTTVYRPQEVKQLKPPQVVEITISER